MAFSFRRLQTIQKASDARWISGLYYHYLYILGKIKQRQYLSKATVQMCREVMRLDQLQARWKNQHLPQRAHVRPTWAVCGLFRFITTGNTTHQQSPTLRKRGAISTLEGECYDILRRATHHAIRPAACHGIGDFTIQGLCTGAVSGLPGPENWQPDCNSKGRAAGVDS